MANMNAEMYDALISAGADEARARAAASAVTHNPDDLVTKADLQSALADLEARLTRRMVTGLIAVASVNLAAIGAATAYLATIINR